MKRDAMMAQVRRLLHLMDTGTTDLAPDLYERPLGDCQDFRVRPGG